MNITYTYTIYDGAPNASGSCELSGGELAADGEAEAREDARHELECAALGCCTEDGYDVGDTLWLQLEDEDSGQIVATIEHVLASDDLGLEVQS